MLFWIGLFMVLSSGGAGVMWFIDNYVIRLVRLSVDKWVCEHSGALTIIFLCGIWSMVIES